MFWTTVSAFAVPAAHAEMPPVVAIPSIAFPQIAPLIADPAQATPQTSPTPIVPADSLIPAPIDTGVAEQAQSDPNEIVVTGDRGTAIDPMRAVNEKAFDVTMAIDDAVTAPIARAYKSTVPSPFRQGVHNFLYNLREPVVFVNFLLQHKIGKAAETLGRFAINTTIGVLGVLDTAKRKPFRLPRRSNGFANTLGFYGVPTGPFLFLPIVGPTTPRDLFGGFVDRLILPFTYGRRITRPEAVVPLAVLGVLDHRSEFDDTLHALHDNVADPYANTRTFYLERRQAEIDHLRGRGPGNSSPMSEPPTLPLDDRGREIRPDPAQ